MTIEVDQVKIAARGREAELLEYVAHLPREVLDGRHHPCPGCGGKDRFRYDQEKRFAICSQCFDQKNGDFLAAIQHFRKVDFPTALNESAYHLGLIDSPNGNGQGKVSQGNNGQQVDPIDQLARIKRCPAEALRRYGAKVNGRRVVFPVYGPDGEQCSTFTINPWAKAGSKAAKGLFAKGKPAGVFLPHDDDGKPILPKPGETWHFVEGVKDAAALFALAFNAVGMPGRQLGQKFSTMLEGVNVVLVPDRDEAGETGANTTAARLYGTAASVKVVVLPAEFRKSHGDDVRDVLAKQDGETLVRMAIADAVPWEPSEPTVDENGVYPICMAEGVTEAMNARRFRVRFGRMTRYCELWSKWLLWDETRWRIDESRHIDGLAKSVAEALWEEMRGLAAEFDPENPDDKKILASMCSFCRSTSTARGIFALLTLAKSEPGIPIDPDSLDGDPWLLNCLNGTIDLRTGQHRQHRREDLITKLAPVAHNAKADCPVWLEFLNTVLAGDSDLVGFVQRLVGYCLTGSTREHVLLFLYGIGANGKSTFISTVLALLGDEYAMKAPTEMLLARSNEAHPTERADLFGKRFVACVEAEDGRRLAESLVKELTGGDKIRARRMREDFWEFSATHKIWLAANHKPTVRGTDHGIWRRIKLIPFSVVIPDDKQDKQLPEKLLTELPGILNWAIAGCLEWQRSGLGEPSAVKDATKLYREDMDVLGDFIEERCSVRDGLLEYASALFREYRDWCDGQGQKPLNQMRFGLQLEERGHTKERDSSSGRVVRHGIGLKT